MDLEVKIKSNKSVTPSSGGAQYTLSIGTRQDLVEQASTVNFLSGAKVVQSARKCLETVQESPFSTLLARARPRT